MRKSHRLAGNTERTQNGKMMIKLWRWEVLKTKYWTTHVIILFLIIEGEPLVLEVRGNGSSSEKYPGSLGEYQLLQERDHNGHPVYQSLASDGRYIIYIGNISI